VETDTSSQVITESRQVGNQHISKTSAIFAVTFVFVLSKFCFWKHWS